MQRRQILGQILPPKGSAGSEKGPRVRGPEPGDPHASDPDTEDAARRHPPVPAHGQGGVCLHTHREVGDREAGTGPAGVARQEIERGEKHP